MVSPSTDQGKFLHSSPLNPRPFLLLVEFFIGARLKAAEFGKITPPLAVIPVARKTRRTRRKQYDAARRRQAAGQRQRLLQTRDLVQTCLGLDPRLFQRLQYFRPVVRQPNHCKRALVTHSPHIWCPVHTPVKTTDDQRDFFTGKRFQRSRRGDRGRGDAVVYVDHAPLPTGVPCRSNDRP